ncbi:ABC transporter ATP-binding protein [Streptomyces sp. JV176]|uniref:ABC transporter ATP-binding protein n=1 Tax=Streptomyces sp. JV176 TaxID=858630 RepID=UPI002E79151E|nr:ABC transporter ATP-binding protein [Streptomyces sp. JV176]MEE1801368.1 ABC transporter ATP-binding protein [Streptomyces sp. JV176]
MSPRRFGPKPYVQNSPPEQLLFGGRLKGSWGWTTHEGARLRTSFLTILRQIPRLIGHTVALAWRADRPALIVVALAQLGQALATVFGLLAANRVLVSLFAAGPTADRIGAALPSLLWVGGAGALAATLRAVSFGGTGRLEPKVERLAALTMLTPVIRVEMEHLEQPDFHKILDSGQHGQIAARRLIQHTLGIVDSLMALIAVSGVLAVLHPVLLPLLVAVVVPKAWGTVRAARRTYESIQVWIEHVRQQSELRRLMISQKAGPELRVHGAGPFLLEQFDRMGVEAAEEQTRLAQREAATDLGTSALSGLTAAATYALLAWLLTHGHMPLASGATAALALSNGTAGLRRMVTHIHQLYEQSLFMTDLIKAGDEARLRAIPAGGVPVPGAPALIEFDQVSFTYPGRQDPALDSVSLTIRRGQTVALVGVNGSGKTTLSKLLAGLYLPSRGQIRWDGTDVRELDRDQLFDQVALVLQDYQRWPFTARANVAISRPSEIHDPERLETAAALADAHTVVGELPRGWDTLCEKGYEGGVDLSGGQWQRLALARAYYRRAAVLICDEPTSSMDPAAEIAAFQQIRRLAGGGQTVILVTHRLHSVRSADLICVLDRGRLVECGDFATLMARDHEGPGVFRELFSLQSEQYRTGVETAVETGMENGVENGLETAVPAQNRAPGGTE